MAKQTAEKSTRLPKKEAVEPKKNGGARPGAGRKPFEPTDAERKQVEALSGYGVPFEQIAALVRDGDRQGRRTDCCGHPGRFQAGHRCAGADHGRKRCN